MSVIGLVVHERREEAAAQALDLTEWLLEEGHEVRVPSGDELDGELEAFSITDDGFADGLDAAISLGGDGSMLRAAQLIRGRDVPILGVDFGQLGYLTTVEPSEMHTAVRRTLAGDCEIEDRMLLGVTVSSSGVDGDDALALNEAVVERTHQSNTIRIAVSIDGLFFTSYAADGLIVATPTGSTAYALSARGPIVAPTHRSFQLTPVSPHMLFDRTLVLDPEQKLRLTVDGGRPAALSIDGSTRGVMGDGDWIECTAAPETVRLVRLDDDHFHSVLKSKFGLNDR